MSSSTADGGARLQSRLTAMYVAMVTAACVGPVLAVFVASGSSNTPWTDGLLWALYMLAAASVAAVLGLIFGVPRARADFTPGASERYSANSNLEQISDWLTKLLVGAGLVELGNVPRHMEALGAYLGKGLGAANPDAFALVSVVYGVGLGFVSGYLWTRLKLRFLLEASDRDAELASQQARVVDALNISDLGADESKSDVRRAAAQAVLRVNETSSTDRLPILWVDDHPENNISIVNALNALGIEVETALTTAEAMSRLARREYALIISDLGRFEDGESHDMAGLELLQQLAGRAVATPVIIFAGARGVENREQLMQAGARLVTQRASEVLSEAARYVTGRRP